MAGAVSRSPRGVRVVAILALLVGTLAVGATPVRAATVEFGRPSIDGSFGTGLVASQPVTLAGAVGRVEVLLTTADSPAPLVSEVTIPVAGGATTLQHTIGGPDAHILPNTPIGRAGGSPLMASPGSGPRSAPSSRDDRFEWKTLRGDVVRVHWYEGDQAFGSGRCGSASMRSRRPPSCSA